MKLNKDFNTWMRQFRREAEALFQVTDIVNFSKKMSDVVRIIQTEKNFQTLAYAITTLNAEEKAAIKELLKETKPTAEDTVTKMNHKPLKNTVKEAKANAN